MTSFAPELVPVVDRLPPRSPPLEDVAATRRAFRALVASCEQADPRVVTEDLTADGTPVRVFRPAAPRDSRGPLIVYFHGGGFVFGSAADASLAAGRLVPELDATVVSVEYRLAPEHIYPAAFEDCYAALSWSARNAERLSCDPARLAVMGPSAGGCLAAATALRARDAGGPHIAFQCLQIPTLEDRRASHAARTVDDPRLVNSAGARAIWALYLGALAEAPAYAAPLRARDLSGLPPAYVQTCEIDPYRDDGLEYARRLVEAGVPAELHDVPGAFHAFELFAPGSRLARDTNDHWMAAMRRALG